MNCCTRRSGTRNSRNCAASAIASPTMAALISASRTPGKSTAALEIFPSWKRAAGRASAAPRWCRTTATPPLSAAPRSALVANGQCEIRDVHGRRCAGGSSHRAAASGPRVLISSSASTSALQKLSPGVQLTLELTRHLCADPAIAARRFHRQSRSSHDQSDLAETSCDRRRADPAVRGGDPIATLIHFALTPRDWPASPRARMFA